MRRPRIAFALTSLVLPLATFAQQEPGNSDGIREFRPDYYLEFDPITALDLVNRTPGFNLQERDGGRGLSGIRSNILINGKRPPPKGQSTQQLLDELPYDDVERIELIDAGTRLDIDMQGYPQVLNVITVPDREAYYELVTEVRRSGTGDVRQQNERQTGLEGTGLFGWNEHEFAIRARAGDRNNRSPADFVAIDPGNPEQRISSLNSFERTDSGLDLSAVFDLGSDSTLSFNSEFSRQDAMSSPISLVEDPGAGQVSQTGAGGSENRSLSTEYRRPFLAGGTVMLALVDSQYNDNSRNTLSEAGLLRSSTNQRESGESALRLRVTNVPSMGLTVRTTLTDAFNYFDGQYRRFENGVELALDGSTSRVEEDRRTLESAVDWNFASRWTFNSELGLDSYEIRSGEISTGTQTDPKGGLALIYRPRPRTTVTLESTREIGQLSFSGFLASSNLTSGILTAGANELEPVRRWVHSAKYDRRFNDVGVLRFELSREEIDNPIRQVALSDTLIVSRNTSEQTIDSLRASVSFPFVSFGREDLILGVNGRLSNSETIDPVTGEFREVSGINSKYWSVELKRDPGTGKLAWGISLSKGYEGDNYSVRSIRSQESERQWQTRVEWEPIEGLKFKGRLEGPEHWSRETLLFDSVRAVGLQPSYVVSTETRRDRFASFTVEWRRNEHLEVTGSLSSRPSERTLESLAAFGADAGTLLATEVATTPRVTLRVRYYN